MRTSCFECAIKHLGSAGVADIEFHMGYPRFKLWVVGNLDHAAQELLQAYPALAMVIREHRLEWAERNGDHFIPYEDLAVFVAVCADIELGTAMPEIPEACIAGLLKDRDGKVVFTSAPYT